MTSNNHDYDHDILMAALKAAIWRHFPEESKRDHSIRLANALRGLFEPRPLPYPEAALALVTSTDQSSEGIAPTAQEAEADD